MSNVPRLVLVMIVVGLLPAEVAMAARWEKAEVPVWDFTPEEWRPIVVRLVEDFNANMPPAAPRLIYIPMGEASCETLPSAGKKGGVTICVGGSVPYMAWQPRVIKGGRFVQGMVQFRSDVPPSAWILCHEMMHAITDAPDADPTNLPHERESCVRGAIDHLGPWDIAYMATVYPDNGHPDRDRPKHHRRH